MNIDLQLKFLQNKLRKKCVSHDKIAESFCYKTTCYQSPYLCPFCDKEKIHTHNDNIGNLLQFLKAITIQISNCQLDSKKVNESEYASIYQQIKQLIGVLRSIQKLEMDIVQIFTRSKEKLKKDIEAKSQKIKKNEWEKFRFYKNPNLLVNKLISESSSDFLFQLKRSLNKQNYPSSSISENYQNELNTVKINIKSIIEVNNSINNTLKEEFHYDQQTRPKIQISLNKIYELPVIASKIYNYNDRMVVCGQKTFLFDLKNKTAILIEPSLIFCATNAQKILIGISSQNILLFYSEQLNIRKNIQIMPKSNPTALTSIYFSAHQIFAIIGYEDGQLDFYSVQEQQNYPIIKKHNKKINNISIMESDKIIITSSQDGRIGLYKYKLESRLLKIQFICFLTGNMEQLSGHQIYKKQIILYNQYGNIKIIDYSLNLTILQSNFTKEKPIVDMLVVPHSRGYFLFTLNKNEKQLKIWNIDCQKCLYKIENSKLFFNNPNISRNSMFLWKDNLWLLKQAAPEIHVASISIH